MKKLVCSAVAALFLAGVSAPLFAAEASKEATPTVKTLKHKTVKHHHKKSARKKKSGEKAKATPVSKK